MQWLIADSACVVALLSSPILACDVGDGPKNTSGANSNRVLVVPSPSSIRIDAQPLDGRTEKAALPLVMAEGSLRNFVVSPGANCFFEFSVDLPTRLELQLSGPPPID